MNKLGGLQHEKAIYKSIGHGLNSVASFSTL